MILVKFVVIATLYILFFLDVKKNSKYFKRPKLFFLNRFIIITILAFLLLNLNFSFNYSRKVKDKISIYLDNSLSIGSQIKNNNKIFDKLNGIQKLLNQKKLSFNFYSFGSNVEKIQAINDLEFSDSQTNFDKLLTFIEKENAEYSIIVSDGVNNGPMINNKLKDLKDNKIFSLGIGEDLFFEDISIDDVYFNNLDFLSDSLSLFIDFTYTLNSSLNKHIEFIFDDKSYNSHDNINFFKGTGMHKSKKYIFRRDDAKKLNYIKINPIEFEKDTTNNFFQVEYNNLFDFNNILLVSGQLNNNTTFIKKLIGLIGVKLFSHQYKIKSQWNKEFDWDSYDLIVFDNYPYKVEDIIEFNKYKNLNNKFVLFLGSNLDSELNNFISELSNLDYSIEKDRNRFIAIDDVDSRESLPPIEYGLNWVSKEGSNCLLSYSNGSCAIFKNDNITYIFMDNLQSYFLQLQKNKNGDILNKFLLENLFLGLHDEPHLVDIKLTKKIFDINEMIELQLVPLLKTDYKLVFEVLNSSNKPVYSKNIESFSKIEKIKFNIVHPGVYNCSIRLIDGEKLIFEEQKQININSINIEEKNLFLNEQYLKNISKKANAKYYQLNDLNDLISNFGSLDNTKTFKFDINYLSLNQFLWLLIILISLDWYLRTRKGIL